MLYILNSIIMVGFISLMFSCYLLFSFSDRIFLHHKYIKQHSKVKILHTGCKLLTQGNFEGQDDCLDK